MRPRRRRASASPWAARRRVADSSLRPAPMERARRPGDSGGMLRRAAVLALAIAPALVQASDLDSAMRCVHGAMTSAFIPATASTEQLASVALMRCADEIEMA